MRPLTMLQAAFRADTQSGEHLSFERCKGGLLSTDPAYTLKVAGQTEGDLCVKAGSTVHCAGKNLWPYGDLHVRGHKGSLAIQLPAGTYTLSARISSEDTHASRCLVSIVCSLSTSIPILRGPERTSISFSLPQDVAKFSFYASDSFNNSYHDGVGDAASFEDIMLEQGSVMTDYEPYAGSEITVPYDLYEGDEWRPSLGLVRRAEGQEEVVPTQTLAAVAGKTLIWQKPAELPARLSATMPVRR